MTDNEKVASEAAEHVEVLQEEGGNGECSFPRSQTSNTDRELHFRPHAKANA